MNPSKTPEKEREEIRADAEILLNKISAEKLLTPRAVYGFFPAKSQGNDIVVADEKVIHTLRKQSGEVCPALSDFIDPAGNDFIGALAVSVGDDAFEKLVDKSDDYTAILLQLIADRIAEASSEFIGRKMAEIAGGKEAVENLKNREQVRPAPGYPACPDHSEKKVIFELLNAESEIGIGLTESFAMTPKSSVCALLFTNPDAHYFSVGKIDSDQLADYAERKKLPLKTVQNLLVQNI